MNFKKHHVSRNILNPESKSTNQQGAERWGGVFPAGTYYVLNNSVDNVYYRDGVSSTSSTTIIPNRGAVITTTNELVVWHGSKTEDIMVAVSSTAVPFEPYGNTWHDTPHYIMGTSTDTLTTLPATIYGDGTNATVGVKGNTVQNGTPAPSAPVSINGVGEMSANLSNITSSTTLSPNMGGQGTYISDNSISIYMNGNTSGIYLFPIANADIVIGEAYVLSFTPECNNSRTMLIEVLGTTRRITFTSGQRYKFVISSASNIALSFYGGDNKEKTIILRDIQIEKGTTAHPYEPYGYKIPILSNSTTTPVYLGEVESTRRIKKLVLTGEEDWIISIQAGHQAALLRLNPIGIESSYNKPHGVCTHYPVEYNNTDGYARIMTNGSLLRIMDDSKAVDMAAWTAFLATQYAAGTPVTVWYVLAEPETAVVNEPLMKIDNYADTVSNVTIPVTAGANTLSVDTTVQPSEVTVNYKGWHPVADVHERENGAWT